MINGSKVFLFSLLLSTVCEARVFNIDKESFAAYLKGSYGPSAVVNTLNSESKGNNVALDSNHSYNLSGEFGFVYATPGVDLRFGLEVIRPPDVKDASGTDASGTSLYSLTSEMSILAPKVSMEFTLKTWAVSKMFLVVGAGYASLAARNSYAFTSAGSTQFSLADFYEDLRAGAPLYEGSLGFESLLTDTTTYVVEAGYRALNFTSVKHNSDITTFQGAVTKGTAATNMDGTDRTLNLNNYFIGLSLRFWLK
jgi:hypothetical protein